jgi:hypothetical protein
MCSYDHGMGLILQMCFAERGAQSKTSLSEPVVGTRCLAFSIDIDLTGTGIVTRVLRSPLQRVCCREGCALNSEARRYLSSIVIIYHHPSSSSIIYDKARQNTLRAESSRLTNQNCPFGRLRTQSC